MARKFFDHEQFNFEFKCALCGVHYGYVRLARRDSRQRLTGRFPTSRTRSDDLRLRASRDRVIYAPTHGWVDLERRQVGEINPLRSPGLGVVRSRLTGDRAGMKEDGELLSNFAVVVCHDMGGVAIDADEPSQLNDDAVSSTTSRSAALATDSPRSTAPPGSAHESLSILWMSRIRPASSRTATVTDGTMLLAGGAPGSL